MVIKNKTLLKAFAMALSMSALSLMAADAAVASDKDEKETHAQHEQVDEKEIAAFIRDIPAQIPVVIPEDEQIDGKPVEESINSADNEALSRASFRSIIETALNKKEQPVLFRVVTHDSDGNDVTHYFDIDVLRNYFKSSDNVLSNPVNKLPISGLSCYVYIPELKRFHSIRGLKSPESISKTQLQELAIAAKEIALFIRDIPAQIPVVIPEDQQIKKDGKPVQECINSDDDEALLLASFRSIIETALNKKEQPILFRVITQMTDMSYATHYFDIEGLKNYFKSQGNIPRNPVNKLPISGLSCCVYIPELKRFDYIRAVKAAQLIPSAHLQELALFQIASSLQDHPQFYEKRRMVLTFLSEQATSIKIKNVAQFPLAMCLYYGRGGPKDSARACQLLESLTKTDGRKVAGSHAYLAMWYWQEREENGLSISTEKIRDHALQAIGDEAAMNELLVSRQADVYRIAGELLVGDINHPQADKALSFLNKALGLGKKAMESPAEQEYLSPGFIARVHAHLALCYYHAPLHGSPEYVPDQGRYERAWHHCTQALSHYEQVKDIDGFVDAAIDMYYFALGNDGDVKKALALCNKKYPDGYGHRLAPVFSHYDYYRASLKEPSKRKEAIKSLQDYIDAQEAEEAREVRYYMAVALLGDMYLHESDRARDLAKLHITSDADFARDCDRKADALDAKAKELFDGILTQMPREYRSSYAWALTHLVLAQKELKSPVKNYETVSRYLRVIYQETEEFPLLASNACALIDDVQSKMETDFLLDDGEPHIHAKDPRYYEKMFQQAMSDYHTVAIDSDVLDTFLASIYDRFKKVADNSTNVLLKAQAKEAVKITEKEFALIRKMLKADESTDEGRAFKRAAIARLACSKSKSIQNYYQHWLKIEEAERAGLSLAMPEDVVLAPMDARPDADAPRSSTKGKRKAEHALVDTRGRDEFGAASMAHIAGREQTNGAGSGSA